jgi:hypothetical protein
MDLPAFNRQTGLNFLPFVEITKVAATVPYKSTFDGFIGLQPYQSDSNS